MVTHELNIAESKCGINTSYSCLFQQYHDSMKQQDEQIVLFDFLIQRRDIFTCLHGVRTCAFFFFNLDH